DLPGVKSGRLRDGQVEDLVFVLNIVIGKLQGYPVADEGSGNSSFIGSRSVRFDIRVDNTRRVTYRGCGSVRYALIVSGIDAIGGKIAGNPRPGAVQLQKINRFWHRHIIRDNCTKRYRRIKIGVVYLG